MAVMLVSGGYRGLCWFMVFMSVYDGYRGLLRSRWFIGGEPRPWVISDVKK